MKQVRKKHWFNFVIEIRPGQSSFRTIFRADVIKQAKQHSYVPYFLSFRVRTCCHGLIWTRAWAISAKGDGTFEWSFCMMCPREEFGVPVGKPRVSPQNLPPIILRGGSSCHPEFIFCAEVCLEFIISTMVSRRSELCIRKSF